MSATTSIYKSDSLLPVTFANDILLLKRLKNHIATCNCCKQALQSLEAGCEPAPSKNTDATHQTARKERYNESKVVPE